MSCVDFSVTALESAMPMSQAVDELSFVSAYCIVLAPFPNGSPFSSSPSLLFPLGYFFGPFLLSSLHLLFSELCSLLAILSS
jgi:hypothetical protein